MKFGLSLDGGGMKGYVEALLLAEVEQRAGKPCWQLFDFMGGTSVGGIIAALIASGQTAIQASEFFPVDGPDIFGNEFPDEGGLIGPRYGASAIEGCLQARLGSTTLGQAKIPLLIPAFELVSYLPVVLTSYDQDSRDMQMWQAARATSAAQSYFPAFQIGTQVYWDGGVAANNPSALILAEAIKLWGRDEDLTIVSLGCGVTGSVYPAQDMVNAGLIKVARETISATMASNDAIAGIYSQLIIGDGYIRIQPGCGSFPIDGATPQDIQNLNDAAVACIQENSSTIDRIVSLVTAQYGP